MPSAGTAIPPPDAAPRVRRIGRLNLEVRQALPLWKHAVFIFGSVAFGLGISVLILVSSGVDVSGIFEEFIVLTFFDTDGLANVLVEWGPLILVGLGASVAFRVQFWNIGVEGQFTCGAIGAAAVTIYDFGPDSGRLVVMAIGALFGGFLWTVLPAFLRLRFGVNEIVTTLLLNYIAALFVLNQLFGAWRDPTDFYHHSAPFESFERLAKLGWGQIHSGLPIAVGTAVLVWLLTERSRFGSFMKFVGVNPQMALAAGIPVTFVIAASVALSGALSGLGGYIMAAGQEFRLTPFLALGYGFSGIVIAFLARNNPAAVVVVSFLMAGLYVAGDSIQVFYGLPAAMVGLVQSIIVMCVVGSDFFVRYRLHWVR
jgi:simple sugar transport system permease protein